MLLVSTAAQAVPAGPLVAKDFINRKKLPKLVIPPEDQAAGIQGTEAPNFNSFTTPAISIGASFEGTSDNATRLLGIGLIPPDTMGAVGTTQYVQLLNGSFSVYSKASGALLAPRITDDSFWAAFGGGSTGGDPRVLFDSRSNRWLAIGFGPTNNVINIGVSESADALGAWKTTQLLGSAAGNTADYPTLSISGSAIMIGTNDFNAGGNFIGTTLNVLNYKNVFAAAGPTTVGLSSSSPPMTAMRQPSKWIRALPSRASTALAAAPARRWFPPACSSTTPSPMTSTPPAPRMR
ncbi:MAG: hypothetical protein ACOYLS_05485 [Polymorphobacter sp.]